MGLGGGVVGGVGGVEGLFLVCVGWEVFGVCCVGVGRVCEGDGWESLRVVWWGGEGWVGGCGGGCGEGVWEWCEFERVIGWFVV